jgi:hypothetical protein
MKESEMVNLEGGVDAETGTLTCSPNLPPEPEIGKGFLKPIPETTPLERAAGGVAGAAVITALAAIIVEQSLIVILGGILSCIVGPYCYYQQTRLTDIRALQETKDAITHEVDRLTEENKRLVQNIDNMTASVDRLQEIDQALEVITATQGQSIDTFSKQVEANKGILQQMRSNLKANVLQNLLSVILRSDSDKDMIIDEPEIEDLIRRIQNISGVSLHEDRFRAAIQGKPIGAVMDIVKNLLRSDIPESERIFEIVQ